MARRLRRRLAVRTRTRGRRGAPRHVVPRCSRRGGRASRRAVPRSRSTPRRSRPPDRASPHTHGRVHAQAAPRPDRRLRPPALVPMGRRPRPRRPCFALVLFLRGAQARRHDGLHRRRRGRRRTGAAVTIDGLGPGSPARPRSGQLGSPTSRPGRRRAVPTRPRPGRRAPPSPRRTTHPAVAARQARRPPDACVKKAFRQVDGTLVRVIQARVQGQSRRTSPSTRRRRCRASPTTPSPCASPPSTAARRSRIAEAPMPSASPLSDLARATSPRESSGNTGR